MNQDQFRPVPEGLVPPLFVNDRVRFKARRVTLNAGKADTLEGVVDLVEKIDGRWAARVKYSRDGSTVERHWFRDKSLDFLIRLP